MATSNTRSVNVAFSISGADSSRQEIGKVRTAVEQFGDEGKAAAQKLIGPLENIEREFDKVEGKIERGKVVTVKDVAAMTQQFDLLEKEIRQTFGTIDKAPVEMQQAFKRAETQLDSTRKKVRDLTDAVDDQKGQLKEGGERWGGFGDAAERAAGKYGPLIAKAGLFTAALSAGWQVGQQLNKLFGTDMSEWDAALERFGKGGKLILERLADAAVSAGGVIAAALTPGAGYGENLKRAWSDFKQATVNATEAIVDNSVVLKRNEDAHKANAIAQDQAKLAAEQLAEKKKALQAQIDGVTKSLAEETKELEKQKGIEAESGRRLVDRSSQLGYYKTVLDAATKALHEQTLEVERLTDQYGENDPFTIQAINRQKQLQLALDEASRRFQTTSEEVKAYEAQQKAAASAVQQHTEKIGELNQQQKQVQAEAAKAGATLATNTAAIKENTAAVREQALTGDWASISAAAQAAAARDLAEANKHGADQVMILVDENGKLLITNQRAIDANKNLNDGLVKLKESYENLSGGPGGSGGGAVGRLIQHLQESGKGLEEFAAKEEVIDRVKQKMKELGDETERVADQIQRAVDGIAKMGELDGET